MILIVMGVSGSGKTTLAHALAALTKWQFAEGDDYHSAANKTKMHAGIPLTDEDRAPWLASLHALILNWYQREENGILTCSALKQSYRETLIAGLPHDVYRFVLTEAPKEVIAQRMLMRHDHFMPETLLDSQIATLELPADAMHVSAEQLPDVAARQVLKSMKIVPST
jgi:gluconokinase